MKEKDKELLEVLWKMARSNELYSFDMFADNIEQWLDKVRPTPQSEGKVEIEEENVIEFLKTIDHIYEFCTEEEINDFAKAICSKFCLPKKEEMDWVLLRQFLHEVNLERYNKKQNQIFLTDDDIQLIANRFSPRRLKLPERKTWNQAGGREDYLKTEAWNAYDTELKRLNPQLKEERDG